MRSSVALSRDFIEAGVDKDAADVIADAIVTHADDSHATKEDIAKLAGKFESRFVKLENQNGILIALIIGLYVAIAVIFLGGGG